MQYENQEAIWADASRCFGRRKAHELSSTEIESVSGGVSYTGIENFQIADNGDAQFEYGDVDFNGPTGRC